MASDAPGTWRGSSGVSVTVHTAPTHVISPAMSKAPGGGCRMFRRTEVAPEGSGREPAGLPAAGATPAGNFVVDPAMPNFSGDFDALLTTAPVFRTSVRGYDRLQVDNYVSWAEAELRTARRETDDLVDRYGRACAELEISRRLLARSPEGQEMTVLSE